MKYRIIANSNNTSQIRDAIIMWYHNQGNWFNRMNAVKYDNKIIMPSALKNPKNFSISFVKDGDIGKNYADIFVVKDETVFVMDKVWNKLRYTTYKELFRTRLGAKLGTEHFKSGTVGYNVHKSISVIKWTFGDLGEVFIGDLFNSPEGQRLLSLPDTKENNLKIAKLEYAYWVKVDRESKFFSENNFGGSLGAFFEPDTRVKLQFTFGFIREHEDKIGKMIDWTKKKINDLL